MADVAPSKHLEAVDGYFEGIGAKDFATGVDRLFGLTGIEGAKGYHPDTGAKALAAVNSMKDGRQVEAMRAFAKGEGYAIYSAESLKEKIDEQLKPMGMDSSNVPGILKAIDNAPDLVAHLNGYYGEQKAAAEQKQVNKPEAKPAFERAQNAEKMPEVSALQKALGLDDTGVANEGLYKDVQKMIGQPNGDGRYTAKLHEEIGQYLEQVRFDGKEETNALRDYHVAMEKKIKDGSFKPVEAQAGVSAAEMALAANAPAGFDFSDAPDLAEPPVAGDHAAMVERWNLALATISYFIPNLPQILGGLMEQFGGMLESRGQSFDSIAGVLGNDSNLTAMFEAVDGFVKAPPAEQNLVADAPELTQEQLERQAQDQFHQQSVEEAREIIAKFQENKDDIGGKVELPKPEPSQDPRLSGQQISMAP